MAAFINTNTSSLNAQRNLSASQSSLTTSLQRLSTGLRINSAKDDAAGLAISERMTSQIKGSDQAARNANDGISLAQTAEGDLSQIGTNLQRIRELAVQSSNASNSASDRAALNNEATMLIAEIDRVASNSSFNGNMLLDGSFCSQSFQVGANTGSTEQISLSLTGDFTAKGLFGATATATAVASSATTTGSKAVALGDNNFAIDGTGTRTTGYVSAATTTATAALPALQTTLTGAQTGLATAQATYDATPNPANLTALNTAKGTFDTANTAFNTGKTALDTATAADTKLNQAAQGENIDATINAIDKSLQSINTTRADLGAKQNRFASTISNLNNIIENATASRSRVQDADFAAETAELTKQQTLQQASTAILSQANQLPSAVLKLLQ